MTDFATFWDSYPRRKGCNPKVPAEKKFNTAIKNGADPKHLISSAKRYGEELKEQNKIGTEYVCMAQTWLNQQRWLDYAPSDTADQERARDERMAKLGWKWDGNRWVKVLDGPKFVRS